MFIVYSIYIVHIRLESRACLPVLVRFIHIGWNGIVFFVAGNLDTGLGSCKVCG
jgi:hypothetical protein